MLSPHTPRGAAAGPAPLPRPSGLLGWYGRTPLYLRLLVALALGVAAGYALRLGAEAGWVGPVWTDWLRTVYLLILRLLGALAPPLVFVAVVQPLVKAQVSGRMAGRMLRLLMVNTVVAVLVGLAVANALRPGRHAELAPAEERPPQKPYHLAEDLRGKLPASALAPFVDNDILGVIF